MECLTWDYTTCCEKTERLISNCFGRDLWNSSFKQVFENYQYKQLFVPQRHLYSQWDFICRLRKTLNNSKHWALNQCLQSDNYIVLHSFMFLPFQAHLFWLLYNYDFDHYADLVKHMVTSMNSMLIHLIDIQFPEDNLMYSQFQQNLTIWFTSFNIKKISVEITWVNCDICHELELTTLG